jgi:hypothetical protein
MDQQVNILCKQISVDKSIKDKYLVYNIRPEI